MDLKDIVYNNAIINQVRAKVSADRSRFKDDGHNLDLSYITDNLIAMGFPASGIEAAWRNHIDEVASMLQKRHGFQHTLIFNLSDRKYDYEKFENRIVEVGFPDHYSPPLDVLMDVVLRIERWVKENPRNVAVVHCVGGKGRTGTVVVCWLLMAGYCSTVQDAFEMFARKRSKIYKGVTQASQKRYVAYFDDVLRKRMVPKANKFILTCIEIAPVPAFDKKKNGCRPRVEVYSCQKYPEKVLWANTVLRTVEATADAVSLELHVPVAGDVLIRCMHIAPNGDKVKMFRVAFHTAFVTCGRAVLRCADLDDLPKGKSAVQCPPDLTVTVHFAEPGPEDLFSYYQEEPNIDLYNSLWTAARRQSAAGVISNEFTTSLGVVSAEETPAPGTGTARRSTILTPKWDVSAFDTLRKGNKQPKAPPTGQPPTPPLTRTASSSSILSTSMSHMPSAMLSSSTSSVPSAAPADQSLTATMHGDKANALSLRPPLLSPREIDRKPIASLAEHQRPPSDSPKNSPRSPHSPRSPRQENQAGDGEPGDSAKPVSNSMQLLLGMSAAPRSSLTGGDPPAFRSAKRHAMHGITPLQTASITADSSTSNSTTSSSSPSSSSSSPSSNSPLASFSVPSTSDASSSTSSSAPIMTVQEPDTQAPSEPPPASSGQESLAKRRSVRELVSKMESEDRVPALTAPPKLAAKRSAPLTPLPPAPEPKSSDPNKSAVASSALSRATLSRSYSVPTKTLPPAPTRKAAPTVSSPASSSSSSSSSSSASSSTPSSACASPSSSSSSSSVSSVSNEPPAPEA